MPSFDRKPSSGGTAAMEAAPMTTEPNVKGMRSHSRPRRRMSRDPASWSMTPMSMNRLDLNSACAAVCTTAAARAKGVPTPIVATIQPRWETVEYAVSCLRSVFCTANAADMTAVVIPAMMSRPFQTATSWNTVEKRSSR